jgi:hypothetical protein
MRIYLDCIPCFFAQALKAARIAGADENMQKKILDEVSKLVPEFPLESTPPETGRIVYQLVNKLTGNEDPFREIKKNSNQLILNLYPRLKMMVENSKDRVLTAIRLAIGGNIIDYGTPTPFDIEEEVANCLKSNFAVFDYSEFKQALDNTDSILYLGDNAGEIVFDKLLIEELEKEVIYVVRNKPIINDVLIEDARDCGIDKIAKVISNGSDAPGTVLNLCSKEFLEIYHKAPLIISKGQGNFETLSEETAPIFFLLKVKCPVIANDIGCKVNDMILKGNLLAPSGKIFTLYASNLKAE